MDGWKREREWEREGGERESVVVGERERGREREEREIDVLSTKKAMTLHERVHIQFGTESLKTKNKQTNKKH